MTKRGVAHLRSQGLLAESVTYKDIISERNTKKHRGFCIHPKCSHQKKAYLIIGTKNLGAWITVDKDKHTCPHCNYPLYWSNRYKKFWRNKCKEPSEEPLD